MATILRGKQKGQTFEVSQYCNDWVTCKEDNRVFRITSIQFTSDEFAKICKSREIGKEFLPDFKTRTFKKISIK
jgi:hypothetical protein